MFLKPSLSRKYSIALIASHHGLTRTRKMFLLVDHQASPGGQNFPTTLATTSDLRDAIVDIFRVILEIAEL